MSDQVIYEELDGTIAVITINRPERRNAINVAVSDGLAAAWRRFKESPARVAVLTGSGDQAFSVGADLNDIPADLWRAIPGVGIDIDKPIVGAVAGWVVGGGLVLAQMCDLLVAADNAAFLYPEAKIGLSAGMVAALAARIPHKIAMEVLLLGEPLSAQRAYEVGFANKLVAVGQQLPAALEYARTLAGNAPLVLQLLKNFVGQVVPKGPAELAGAVKRQAEVVAFSQDREEGVLAFHEKRPPAFTGR